MDRYAAAFYWSVMTLTSIGYGEFTAHNTAERVLCSLYMLISGMMWTYAIGSVAAIATTLNPHRIMYENTMDQLNYFMRDRSLSRAMRITLREFFQSARRVHQLNGDAELLSKMSPLLQGSVALAANKRWIDQIWFFRDLGNSMKGVEFIASLAKRLVLRNFVANERLPIGQLYILRRGLCVKMCAALHSRLHTRHEPSASGSSRRRAPRSEPLGMCVRRALFAQVALPRCAQGVGRGHHPRQP